jgi:hypothetical protein
MTWVVDLVVLIVPCPTGQLSVSRWSRGLESEREAREATAGLTGLLRCV